MKRSIIIVIVMLCLFGCCLFFLYSLGYLSFDKSDVSEDKSDVSFEVTFKKDTYDMKYCDGKGCLNVYERYQIPNITKGYYYFLDRHSESTNKKSAENINNRASYNFTLGIYDNVNKILYFYELDT